MRTPLFSAAAALFAAVVMSACKPQQLAPDAPYVEPELRVADGGLWQSAGTTRIQGVARGVSDVTVNGSPAQVSGEQFAADVPLSRGANLLEARGVDGHGDAVFARQGVLAGEFASPDGPIADALTLRLNESGLNKATQMVSGLIDPVAIGGSIGALNPVYSDAYGVLGWDAVTVEANLNSLAFSPLVILPDARPGVLYLEIHVPNLEVNVGVEGEIVGIDFSEDAWIGADDAVVTANAIVSVQNGQLQLELVAPTVALNGFWYDLSLIPGDIESYILVDTVRGAIEDMLLGQLEERVPPLLEGALADLDISFETELLGKQVAISADFTSATIDDVGLQLGAAIAVSVPGDAGKPWVGYLSAPTADARPSMADDVGLAVSDNLLNGVFFQAWRSGMLQLDLDSARGDIEPIFLSQLGATDAARVVVDAQLPPVVVERDGRLQAQVTELLVRIETPDGDNGEYLDLAVTVFMDVDMQIRGGVLGISMGTPELILDVRDSDWGASNNAITNLLAAELPIDTLLALVGDLEFPLPSLAGITIGDADAGRDSTGVYTSVGVNF